MTLVAILYITTIGSVYGVLQVGKMVHVDAHVVEEKLAWPGDPEKPETAAVDLTYNETPPQVQAELSRPTDSPDFPKLMVESKRNLIRVNQASSQNQPRNRISLVFNLLTRGVLDQEYVITLFKWSRKNPQVVHIIAACMIHKVY